MRNFLKPVAMSILLAASWTAFGAGGGSMPSTGGGGSASQFEPRSPEETARLAYNAGVQAASKKAMNSVLTRRGKLMRKSSRRPRTRRGAPTPPRSRNSRAPPSSIRPCTKPGTTWATTNRKLGKYQEALIAYDRALNLKPGYAEAIEYRGHAYLGLNRLDDAKQAYLALFAGNRKLAAQLLAAMQTWVGEHRGNPGPASTAHRSMPLHPG